MNHLETIDQLENPKTMGPRRIKDIMQDSQVTINDINKSCRMYEFVNDTGHAKRICYQLFEGIELTFQDVSLEEITHHAQPMEGLFEIYYCHDGRIECDFTNGKYLYLNPNDITICWKRQQGYQHSSYFPSSKYQGVSLAVYVPKAQAAVDAILGAGKLDLRALCNRFCHEGDYGVVSRLESHLSQAFASFYDAPKELAPSYYRVKAIELLVLLHSAAPEINIIRSCYNKQQVDIVKQVHEELVQHITNKETIDDIALRYHIPSTSLKKCFKGVYGITMYQFIKQNRMQRAASLLIKSNDNIVEIARQVGYENGSKFSVAFAQVMGVKPSEYRRSHKE